LKIIEAVNVIELLGLIHLLKPILFYSGDTGDLIQRKDIEFNPDPHPVQEKAKEKQESTVPPHCTTNKQEQQ
jgi:hypothetical protein